MENKYYHYDIRNLINMDPTDPIFDEIAKQRKNSFQFHHVTGYQLVKAYYNAILAENLVKNYILHRDPYNPKPFGNTLDYVRAEMVDDDRMNYLVSKDGSRIPLKNQHDINAYTMFDVEHIEVKCLCIDKQEAFDCFTKKHVWNPYHRYFSLYDREFDDNWKWKQFCKRYTHDADVVVIVPIKDGEPADKQYGIAYYRTKDTQCTIKEYPSGGGYRFYVPIKRIGSLYFQYPDNTKYTDKDGGK